MLNQSGVYKIECDECEAFYIGETGRPVKKRIQEHRRNKERSAFGRHLIEKQHTSINDEKIKILHVLPKGLKLTLTEAYEIWKASGNPNLLNEQVDLNFQPLFKSCL